MLPVLVVDDEPSIRHSLARVLSRHGMAVATAENGLAAVAACGREDFRAIISDVRMEFMDGLALFDELRSERPELAGRMVFVTAWAHDPTTRAALERTGRPVLLKPFDMLTLVNLVRHVAEDRPGNPGSFARFSESEATIIRDSVLTTGRKVSCPCCNGDLILSSIAPGSWEVRCGRCLRSLTVGDIPVRD